MEYPILISTLNDFIFCPASIYFHNLYESMQTIEYQCNKQIDGTFVHKSVDNGTYGNSKRYLQGVDVFCERYGIVGKIDCFDVDTGVLTERKKKIQKIYDGYVFQVYAQYFALTEMGYVVNEIKLHSFDTNTTYDVLLPSQDETMLKKFETTLDEMRNFDLFGFVQANVEKCKQCIYRNYCDRTLDV